MLILNAVESAYAELHLRREPVRFSPHSDHLVRAGLFVVGGSEFVGEDVEFADRGW